MRWTDRPRALFDLLPWDVFVAEGVLRNVDGGLSVAFRYRGPDAFAATDAELDGLLRTLTRAFTPLGDGWMLLFDLHRVPAPGFPEPGAFPDAFTRELDDERRAAYEADAVRFRSETFLTITFREVGEGPARGRVDLAAEERVLETFLDRVDEVVGVLASAWRLERLDTPEFVRYLYRCLTGRFHELAVPRDAGVSLEAVLGAGDLFAGKELRFAETHLVPIALTGFPESVLPAALDLLHELPLPLRASFRFLPFDPFTGRQVIERVRSHWATAGVRLKDVFAMLTGGVAQKPTFADRYAPTMAQNADQALVDLETTQGTCGYLTPVLFATGEDRREALERAGRLIKALRNRGFAAWVEELGALDAYLGALPGEGRSNVRRPIVSLRAALCLAPTTSVWSGPQRHPHPALSTHPPHVVTSTSGSTPFALSLSAGDVMHSLIVGPTGSGKSVLLNLLLAQWFRYPGAQVFSLDKGRSQQTLVEAAGGCHYDLASDAGTAGAGYRFAPLAHLDDSQDFQQAFDWLLDLLTVAGVNVGAAERSAVGKALRHLADAGTRTLSSFALKLQDRALRQALEPYILAGPYAGLFDGEASPLRTGRFQVFEMESVLPLQRRVVAPLVLHLFREIERRLDGRPTLLAVEEVAGYLADTLFADRFRQWVLELRKKNTGVVFVAQNLAAFLESSLRPALLENTPTKIYLPNPAAREPSVAAAYRAFGLNDREIEILAAATPKRDYYLSSPEGSRLFTLDLSERALGVLGRVGGSLERLSYPPEQPGRRL